MLDFETALRATELVLAFAFLQQSLEYLKAPGNPKWLFAARIVFSVALVIGFYTNWVVLGLFVIAIMMLHRFQGPYNGGSDRMSILIVSALLLVHFSPTQFWKELFFGYLGLQLVLSYFISGWVKVVNPDWRNGSALKDVFLYSAYPVSGNVRAWSAYPNLLLIMSWSVILFELVFPLTFLNETALILGLVVAATFHFTNACLFGLNRFFWIWLAAYPSIIWLQSRVFGLG